MARSTAEALAVGIPQRGIVFQSNRLPMPPRLREIESQKALPAPVDFFTKRGFKVIFFPSQRFKMIECVVAGVKPDLMPLLPQELKDLLNERICRIVALLFEALTGGHKIKTTLESLRLRMIRQIINGAIAFAVFGVEQLSLQRLELISDSLKWLF